jgi:hypothetical protein
MIVSAERTRIRNGGFWIRVHIPEWSNSPSKIYVSMEDYFASNDLKYNFAMPDNKSVPYVGPGIRRPLDPDQKARNIEAVLRIIDPETGNEVNLLKCIRVELTRVAEDEQKRRVECTGYLITKNHLLLKRISKTDERFTWSLTSTSDEPKGSWLANLETVPDFSSEEIAISLLYDAPKKASSAA